MPGVSQTRLRIKRLGVLHPEILKICRSCQQAKPRSEFGRMSQNWDGYKHKCKACYVEYQRQWRLKNPEAARRKEREWRQRNPQSQRPRHLRHRYGLEVDTYQQLVVRQGGACAICGTVADDPWNMQVDHCHTTGKIRGLLCHKCNKGIGLLGDDPDRVAAALRYLLGVA